MGLVDTKAWCRDGLSRGAGMDSGAVLDRSSGPPGCQGMSFMGEPTFLPRACCLPKPTAHRLGVGLTHARDGALGSERRSSRRAASRISWPPRAHGSCSRTVSQNMTSTRAWPHSRSEGQEALQPGSRASAQVFIVSIHHSERFLGSPHRQLGAHHPTCERAEPSFPWR